MRILLLSIATLTAAPALANSGTLVIVGGGLSPDNAEIYNAFSDRATMGNIVIIPSASAEPQASLDAFTANLIRHGIDSSRIVAVRLAEVDDPATPVDEAGWAGNASNTTEIAKIDTASGIWFTGGDQARTIRLLVREDKDTPMLTAIRKRLAFGAVIGGTSAGAAIMGSGMILCGDPRQANDPISRDPADCAPKEGESEPLVLGEGLSFLADYVVDQHFSQRARLPRLVRAVACGSGQGIGVDEDTALVVDLGTRRARVAGKGTVSTVALQGKADCTASHVTLHQYRAGERFRLRR